MKKQYIFILILFIWLNVSISSVLGSDDNSLADLGIVTEGVTVTPDFSYDTWTYDVTVPEGVTELVLSPIPSSYSATIAEISGTTLNSDGTGTVYITVQAASGAQFTYTLNVTGGGETVTDKKKPDSLDSIIENLEDGQTTFSYNYYTFELLADGTLEVQGYTGYSRTLTVPGKIENYLVTRIGNRAFFQCYNLTSVDLPDSLVSIGQKAFAGCNSLKSIDLPDGLTSIGHSAFSECFNLTSIDLPDGLTSIEDETFQNCISLKRIAIPESITYVGENPFVGCSDLSFLIIPDHQLLAVIDGVLFCKPEKRLVFCPNNLEEYSIPDGIMTIGSKSFADCTSLRSITLPNSIVNIEDFAFTGCTRLTNISLPESISYIGENPFLNCEELAFEVAPDHPFLKVVDGALICKPDMKIISFANGKEEYSVPDGIICIGIGAFAGCDNLKRISIPESVINIEDNAFAGCENLLITIEPGSYAEDYCKENRIDYVYPESTDWLKE